MSTIASAGGGVNGCPGCDQDVGAGGWCKDAGLKRAALVRVGNQSVGLFVNIPRNRFTENDRGGA